MAARAGRLQGFYACGVVLCLVDRYKVAEIEAAADTHCMAAVMNSLDLEPLLRLEVSLELLVILYGRWLPW